MLSYIILVFLISLLLGKKSQLSTEILGTLIEGKNGEYLTVMIFFLCLLRWCPRHYVSGLSVRLSVPISHYRDILKNHLRYNIVT